MSDFSNKTQVSYLNSDCSCFNILRVRNDGIMEMKEDTKSTEIMTG